MQIICVWRNTDTIHNRTVGICLCYCVICAFDMHLVKDNILVLNITYSTVYCHFVTNHISEGSNAIASVHLFVCLFPLYFRNRLTVHLYLLHVSRYGHSSQETEGQGHLLL